MIEKIEVFVASCNKCSMPFPDDVEPVTLPSKKELADHIAASDWSISGTLDNESGEDSLMIRCPECIKKKEE